ncbi:hypothetical protein D3C87_870900 [compost metagenome]
MKWLKSTPSRRAMAYTAAQTLPLCVSRLTRPGPCCIGAVLNTEAKLVWACVLRLAKPMAFGPATTMSVVATKASSSACNAAPASPASAKPAAYTMTARTPRAWQRLSIGVTSAAASASTTRSGAAGSASRSGQQRRPKTSSYFGLIG